MAMHPAVFLDLDNTIIRDSDQGAGPDSVALIKGAAPAIASLRGLGYRVVVVANHDRVARGAMSEDDVEALHAKVAELVRQTANGAVIDAFYYCPYHPKATVKDYKQDHRNRKPKPGMLTQAAEEMSLDLSASWMIGDELADVQAGHGAGVRTILLRPDAERLQPMDAAQLAGVTSEAPDMDRPAGPDFFAVGLVDAARLIAQQPRVDQAESKPNKPGRKWDAEKIAKLQVPRPAKKPEARPEPVQAGRAFRPWGAPVPEEDDKPIVAKPYRKRQQQEDRGEAAEPGPESVQREHAPPPSSAAAPPAQNEPRQAVPTAEPAAPAARAQPVAKATGEPREIPESIRLAKEKKQQAAERGELDEDGAAKTLRLILQELRMQRGASNEFSFLTIIAVSLTLIGVVCLLGGLFMGGADDGLFLRWLGAGVMAQLIAIATLLYGR